MYNRQLDTFQLVAEKGSFSAASEKLYVSPSAVNQQITVLEDHLKVKLFNRSRQGLTLTPAGEYLLEELPSFIQHSNSIIKKLAEFSEAPEADAMQVGIPHMHTIRYFYRLWTKFTVTHPEGKILLTASNSWAKSEVFEYYASCDLVEYPNVRAEWMKTRSFLKLEDMPIALAVPAGHPLYTKERLSLSDFRDCELVTPKGAFTETVRPGLDLLAEQGARFVSAEQYRGDLLDSCQLHMQTTLVLQENPYIPPAFRCIPIDWDISIPYGFSCKNPPGRLLKQFLNFTIQETGAEYI